VIRPITQRWRVGSGAAVPALPIASATAIASEPDLQRTWKGPAILVELGPPIPVGLPLGWRPGSNGAAPALRRILHYPLADLLAAARSGGTLADLAKA
jgi:1-acyl-sn-glycerol-3-phosphate acyltransferase